MRPEVGGTPHEAAPAAAALIGSRRRAPAAGGGTKKNQSGGKGTPARPPTLSWPFVALLRGAEPNGWHECLIGVVVSRRRPSTLLLWGSASFSCGGSIATPQRARASVRGCQAKDGRAVRLRSCTSYCYISNISYCYISCISYCYVSQRSYGCVSARRRHGVHVGRALQKESPTWERAAASAADSSTDPCLLARFSTCI